MYPRWISLNSLLFSMCAKALDLVGVVQVHAGPGGAAARQPWHRRVLLSENAVLRAPLLSLCAHWRHREAAEDAQDLRSAQRRDVALSERAVPRQRTRSRQDSAGTTPPSTMWSPLVCVQTLPINRVATRYLPGSYSSIRECAMSSYLVSQIVL